jgi:hypothetical protein
MDFKESFQEAVKSRKKEIAKQKAKEQAEINKFHSGIKGWLHQMGIQPPKKFDQFHETFWVRVNVTEEISLFINRNGEANFRFECGGCREKKYARRTFQTNSIEVKNKTEVIDLYLRLCERIEKHQEKHKSGGD